MDICIKRDNTTDALGSYNTRNCALSLCVYNFAAFFFFFDEAKLLNNTHM